MKRMNATT